MSVEFSSVGEFLVYFLQIDHIFTACYLYWICFPPGYNKEEGGYDRGRGYYRGGYRGRGGYYHSNQDDDGAGMSSFESPF